MENLLKNIYFHEIETAGKILLAPSGIISFQKQERPIATIFGLIKFFHNFFRSGVGEVETNYLQNIKILFHFYDVAHGTPT